MTTRTKTILGAVLITLNHTSNGSAWIAKNDLGETVFHGEGEHTIPKDEKR